MIEYIISAILFAIAVGVIILFLKSYNNNLKKNKENFSDDEKEKLEAIEKKLKLGKIICIVLILIIYSVILIIPNIFSIIRLLDNEISFLITGNVMEHYTDNWMQIFREISEIYYLLLANIVLGMIIYRIYIRITGKLNKEEKELALKYYSGKIILGIVLSIVTYMLFSISYTVAKSVVYPPM